eukprot:jgi/Botrbrau1/14780/Bobra.0284s0013.1
MHQRHVSAQKSACHWLYPHLSQIVVGAHVQVTAADVYAEDGCLEPATSLLHTVVESEPGHFLGWSLLGLLYEKQSHHDHARNAASQARKAYECAPGLQRATVHLQVAEYLCRLRLGACATAAIYKSASPLELNSNPAIETHRALLVAWTRSLSGQEPAADEARRADSLSATLRERGEPLDPHWDVLVGDLHHECGNTSQARNAYSRAINANPSSPLHCYYRLGQSFINNNQHQQAYDAFARASELYPTCRTWMGAGIAAIYLRDYSNADIALCEASRLDPENPDVWTWLAFLAAKLHRRQEAATCMAWASNHRTENAELLQRLSMEFEELGW